MSATLHADPEVVAGNTNVFLGLKDAWPERSPEEAASLAPTASRLASHLLEQLQSDRDLAAAEAGTLAVNLTPVSPAALLADIRQLYAQHEAAEGKAIVSQVFSKAPAITTDGVLLRRVLGYLLRNALEASVPGDEVTLRHSWIGSQATFTVHNPAVMTQSARVQVFQRGGSMRRAGRGLGTYGARLIVERCLGGTLRFGSNVGTGTVFALDLPIRR